MKICFETLGCKVNLFETQALGQLAQERGHELVSRGADAAVLNTCSVTSVSEHKNIRAIHRLRRANPDAVLAVCGCFAQLDPDRLGAIDGVDLVCGTSDRAAVIAALEEAVLQGRRGARLGLGPAGQFELLRAGIPAGRTRALLKIQDGCDRYCTYCIIPYVRGHIRSMPSEAARAEVRRLAASGVREIVVTGIEIASYGVDLGEGLRLADLLELLLADAPQVRFRLGSLEPGIADEAFCRRLGRFPNLAPHFHLSLQSGCDSVLKRMRRRYDTALYKKNAEGLRAAFPGCSITTDLIVGFPGETEDEFAQTLGFLEGCGFAAVHVFPYSLRKGTVAAKMEGQLPTAVKEERAARAKAVARACGERYRQTFLGKELSVLLEHRTREGLWSGHAPYAFPVYISAPEGRKNAMCQVRLTGLYQDGMKGEWLRPLSGKPAPETGSRAAAVY